MTEFVLQSDLEEIANTIRQPAQDFAGKTVLLTGSHGFLGRHFVAFFAYLNEHVLPKPVKVLAYDNLIAAGKFGAQMQELPNITFVNHDVSQPFAIDEPVDYVMHAAGIASPYYYRAFPLETLDVAVVGTRNLLQLATQHDARFVFFSSSEIYGDPDPRHIPILESYRGNVACLGPRACYDESKRVGETLCYIFHDKEGTHTSIVRPFNVYGPGMQEQDYRVLPNFANRLKAGLPLNVYGSGRQTRTFCYIADAISGFLLTVLRGQPGEPYNIGNPTPEVSILELVKIIEKAMGRPVECNVIDYPDSYPADEPNRRCPDIRKARLQLGFAPVVTLEDGLQRFFSWTDRVYTGAQ